MIHIIRWGVIKANVINNNIHVNFFCSSWDQMGIQTEVPKALASLNFTIVNLYPATYIKYEFDL